MDYESYRNVEQNWRDLASQRARQLEEKRTEISAKKSELEASKASEQARLEADLTSRKKKIEDEDEVNAKARDDELAAQIAELQRLREVEREASRKSIEMKLGLAKTEIQEQRLKVDEEFKEKQAELNEKTERDHAELTSEWEKQDLKIKEDLFEALKGNVGSSLLRSPSPLLRSPSPVQSLLSPSVPAQVDIKPDHGFIASPDRTDPTIEYIQNSKNKKGRKLARRGRKGCFSRSTDSDRHEKDQYSRLSSPGYVSSDSHSSQGTLSASHEVQLRRSRSPIRDERFRRSKGRVQYREVSYPSTRSRSRNVSPPPRDDASESPKPASRRSRRRLSPAENDTPSSKRVKTSSTEVRAGIGLSSREGLMPVMAASNNRLVRWSRDPTPSLSSPSTPKPNPPISVPRTMSEVLSVYLGTSSLPKHKNDKLQPLPQFEQPASSVQATTPARTSPKTVVLNEIPLAPTPVKQQHVLVIIPEGRPTTQKEQAKQQTVNSESAPQPDQQKSPANTPAEQQPWLFRGKGGETWTEDEVRKHMPA